MNTDFDGVNRVRIRTPHPRCASPFKYRASPCKVRSDSIYSHGLSWYYYGLMPTYEYMTVWTSVFMDVFPCIYACDDVLYILSRRKFNYKYWPR